MTWRAEGQGQPRFSNFRSGGRGLSCKFWINWLVNLKKQYIITYIYVYQIHTFHFLFLFFAAHAAL